MGPKEPTNQAKSAFRTGNQFLQTRTAIDEQKNALERHKTNLTDQNFATTRTEDIDKSSIKVHYLFLSRQTDRPTDRQDESFSERPAELVGDGPAALGLPFPHQDAFTHCLCLYLRYNVVSVSVMLLLIIAHLQPVKPLFPTAQTSPAIAFAINLADPDAGAGNGEEIGLFHTLNLSRLAESMFQALPCILWCSISKPRWR